MMDARRNLINPEQNFDDLQSDLTSEFIDDDDSAFDIKDEQFPPTLGQTPNLKKKIKARNFNSVRNLDNPDKSTFSVNKVSSEDTIIKDDFRLLKNPMMKIDEESSDEDMMSNLLNGIDLDLPNSKYKKPT